MRPEIFCELEIIIQSDPYPGRRQCHVPVRLQERGSTLASGLTTPQMPITEVIQAQTESIYEILIEGFICQHVSKVLFLTLMEY